MTLALILNQHFTLQISIFATSIPFSFTFTLSFTLTLQLTFTPCRAASTNVRKMAGSLPSCKMTWIILTSLCFILSLNSGHFTVSARNVDRKVTAHSRDLSYNLLPYQAPNVTTDEAPPIEGAEYVLSSTMHVFFLLLFPER